MLRPVKVDSFVRRKELAGTVSPTSQKALEHHHDIRQVLGIPRRDS